MSVNNKIHVVQISPVTTLLDHTDVSVRWDLLQTLGLRMRMIQFVLVRNSTCCNVVICSLGFLKNS